MNTIQTPDTMLPNASSVSTTRKPNRFDPRTWSRGKKITALAMATVFVVGGWALFRPELIFVNTSVNETLTTSGQNAATLVSQGQFASLGHHTEGGAQLYKGRSGYILRFSKFSTSNGPDVRVYLTQGAGIDSAAIKAGKFLDLGTIKGNVGDQNYNLPASFDPAKYEGVSIWCKRFGVNFAGASFGQQAPTQSAPIQAAVPAPSTAEKSGAVVVTTGKFHKVGEGVTGNATITEDGAGLRTLTLTNFQSAKGPKLRIYLVKAEDVKDSASIQKTSFIDLGALKSLNGTQSYKVPKDIDLWQFLSVTVWCDQFKVNFATAPLSSPQN